MMHRNVREGGSDGCKIRYAMNQLSGGLCDLCEQACKDEGSDVTVRRAEMIDDGSRERIICREDG